MDAHRATAYVVGPYVKQGAAVRTRYSSVNMVRTIEDVLGLERLNLNTAYQRPMVDVFDITLPGTWSCREVASTVLKTISLNFAAADDGVQLPKGPAVLPTRTPAWWAEHTKGFDFTGGAFNRVIWQGMMGDKPYPTVRTGSIK